MKGDLKDFHVDDLVHICCQHPDDVRLTLMRDEATAAIWFSGGAIVHSESARGLGKPALLDILSWETGSFLLEKDVKAPLRTIDQPWVSLLEEAAEFLALSRRQLDGDGAARGPVQDSSTGNSSAPDEVVKRLRNLPGVHAALLSGSGGEILAHAGDGDPEHLAAVSAFVGGSAREMGLALDLGALKRAVVQTGPGRVLVAGFGSGFVGMRLAEDAAVDKVCGEARSLVGWA